MANIDWQISFAIVLPAFHWTNHHEKLLVAPKKSNFRKERTSVTPEEETVKAKADWWQYPALSG